MRQEMVEPGHRKLSVVCQTDLLGISRSGFYYRPRPACPETLALMDLLDRQYLETPFYGVRRMTEVLKRAGHDVGRDRVRRLMRLMGLLAIYPKPRTSIPDTRCPQYPYLLRNLAISRPNQVWGSDITYLRLAGGFVYLVAILDLFSRYVLSWELSNTLDTAFCLDALDDALGIGTPEIFNSDQGVQFTSEAFLGRLKERDVRISMCGRGRCFDNIFVERLWRSVKYEEVYIHEYRDIQDAAASLRRYFDFFNEKRPHQHLGYRTPSEVYGEAVRQLERA